MSALPLVASFVLALLAAAPLRAAEAQAELYPELTPFRTGHLRVSPIHEIYYELSGNPKGAPVMLLHGGPGGSSHPGMRRYHDPKKWLIILADQRGTGKSRPHLELRENDTSSLVEDIERLRRHLGLGKVHVFGGSWGSTLGLAYAERYPRQVSSLLLRGIFLGTKAEVDHFYHGGTAAHFPETWARLRALIPRPEQLDYPRQLLSLLTGPDRALRERAARAWSAYETKLAFLQLSDVEVEQKLAGEDLTAFALLENHYMANRCFLEEGQLLRDAGRLAGIPTVIVQGRYDVICPPQTAHRLHQALPGSRLVLVEAAAHSASEPALRAALVAAARSLEPPGGAAVAPGAR